MLAARRYAEQTGVDLPSFRAKKSLMGALLQDCLERIDAAKSKGLHPLAIFDLDGTLFNNGPRTVAILRDFADSNGLTELSEKLVTFKVTDYRLSDTLDALNFNDEALRSEIIAYWMEHFFSDARQLLDVPTPGAVSFVNTVREHGATTIYLTGRDAKKMGTGCFDALRNSGFPVGVCDTLMLLKPTFEEDDLEFKREALAFINKLGTVVTSLDNEPGNCNLFHQAWPDALVALCDTSHTSTAPPLHADLGKFRDFNGGVS